MTEQDILKIKNALHFKGQEQIYRDDAYGGNQGNVSSFVECRLLELNEDTEYLDENSRKEANYMIKVTRNYFPNASNEDIKNLTISFRDNGCGYILYANNLCSYFANLYNGDKLFKEIFDFDLFYTINEQKYFNINCLALELYLKYTTMVCNLMSPQDFNDNFCGSLYIENDNLDELLLYYGIFINHKQRYCTSDILLSSIKGCLKKYKFVYIASNDFLVHFADTNEDCHLQRDHGMALTDIDDNGNLIVSSWGEKCVLTFPENAEEDAYISLTAMSFHQFQKDTSLIDEIIEDIDNRVPMLQILAKLAVLNEEYLPGGFDSLEEFMEYLGNALIDNNSLPLLDGEEIDLLCSFNSKLNTILTSALNISSPLTLKK